MVLKNRLQQSSASDRGVKKRDRDFWILAGLWLISAMVDRLWIALDRAIPAWDQTHHLTGSLNYLNAFQHAQWESGDWWQGLLMLSSKNPPLAYIGTALLQQIFGRGPDQALLLMLPCTAILLVATYGLGKHLFNRQVGLFAAIFCLLMPELYRWRIQYLLDYPVTAIAVASFWFLTLWRDERSAWRQWLWGLAFGFCFACALLIKQGVLFSFVVPLLWLGGKSLWKRTWGRSVQLAIALLFSFALCFPWYGTNWIYFIGNFSVAMLGAVEREGDPALNTLDAWIYYLEGLPNYVSFPLLLVGIAGFLLFAVRWMILRTARPAQPYRPNFLMNPRLGWLALFLLSTYFIYAAIPNKDSRYMMPALPAAGIVLAYGLTLFPKRWASVRWGTVGVAAILTILHLFPVGGEWGTVARQALSSNSPSFPYRGPTLPHTEIVEEIRRTTPQLQATVGVLADSPEFNHNNFNYYGALADFQVYGREVGFRRRNVERDVRSIDWLIARTDNQWIPDGARGLTVARIKNSPEFQLHKTWPMPDRTLLELYHRQPAPIQVQPIPQALDRVQLDGAIAPAVAPPGQPLPVTYEWSGPWEQLRSGLVLLTWKLENSEFGVRSTPFQRPATEFGIKGIGNGQEAKEPSSMLNAQCSMLNETWFHDRAIASGLLHSGRLSPQERQGSFQVREQTAMLPPATLTPGIYTLEATYLNRETGESYAIASPPIRLKIDPKAPPTPAPEVDLVTQLRNLAAQLPQGRPALDPIFDEIGRINQYDPTQDYAKQAELAAAERLQQDPRDLESAYLLALANGLQEDAEGAIAALEQVAQLDPQNPYAHAYLAVVYLYRWQPKAAETALQPALDLNPDLLELQALHGVAALMQGHWIQAWQILTPLLGHFSHQ